MHVEDAIRKFSIDRLLRIITYVKNHNYKYLWEKQDFGDVFINYDEFLTFCTDYVILLRNRGLVVRKDIPNPTHEELSNLLCDIKDEDTEDFIPVPQNIDNKIDSSPKVEESDIEDISDDFLHTKDYYYNDEKDEYIVHLPSKPKAMILSGVFWRSVVSAYSNWDNQPSTINQMCRKFSMSRRTIVELLRCMGVTHDSSPYTDEILAKSKEEDLVLDLLRRKEERILLQAEQREYRRVQKDALRYRNYKNFVQSIKILLEDIDIETPVIEYTTDSGDFAVLLSPTDFHWGKYASPITGDEYNREVARQRLFETTHEVLDRVSQRGTPEKIIVAIGGDGLHIDNQQKTTTRGTVQDCDGVATEIAASYVRLCIEYVNMIRQFAPVEVYVVAGNHDYYTSAILREAMRAWFRNEHSVKVDEEVAVRRTFLYGKSLITLMHGDNGSTKDFPAIIAGESAELWGKSDQRFIFTGHLHTERELPTFGNITVYRMPSLAGTDDWHWQKGYKSRKALIGYILDPKKGVIATEISPC